MAKKNRIIEKKIRKGIMSGNNFMWKFIRYIHNSKYFGH